MYYNVQTTLRCNLHCKYCEGGLHQSVFPSDVTYSIEDLRNFILKDEHPVILFYGGEPLLNLDFIKKIMDEIPAEAFILQTNGLLLHEIESEYLKRFHSILVSIDGTEEMTDLNRHAGTYRKVLENIRLIRRKGFDGEIIARMTVTEQTSIYKEVNWLLKLQDPRFDSIHWQISFMFTERNAWKDLESWIESYNAQVNQLIDEWVENMEKHGKVRVIYPFVAIMHSLLHGEKSKLRCGCGWIWHNICTDGTIAACPVAAEFGIFHEGTIFESEPEDLKDAMSVGEPCLSCEIYELCGGRCLYANLTKPWGEKDFLAACKTVKNLISKLKDVEKKVKKLIAQNIIKLDDFNYFKYNGCEIIP
ncbi:MAG: TIGR04084 family radical SAM/SPASM domain-containing protein [Candidatus Helarchaeales archaeon]